MDQESRRFLYSLMAGGVISGVLFWTALHHFRVLEVSLFAAAVAVLSYLRARASIPEHGRRRKIRVLKIFFLIVFVLLLGLALAVEFNRS